jgi:hypothetical protein
MQMRNTRRPLRYVVFAAAIICIVYLHRSITSDKGGGFSFADREGGKFEYVEKYLPKGWGKTNKIKAVKSSYDWSKLSRRNPILYDSSSEGEATQSATSPTYLSERIAFEYCKTRVATTGGEEGVSKVLEELQEIRVDERRTCASICGK